VSVIGLGGSSARRPGVGVATSAWPRRHRSARAAELGVTLFGTAESYGRGKSERMLGDALSRLPARESIIVATKVSGLGLTRERVRAARASLKRLGTDWIDLDQVHGLDGWVPETVKMAGMRDLLPHAAANDRLIIGWRPLEQGLLADKYTRGSAPRCRRPSTELFSSENLLRAAPVIGTLREVATTHDATPAQVALAWLVHHLNVVAIPGAKSLSQLKENAAADLMLTDDEVTHLTAVADRFRPARHRREQARRGAMRARGRMRQLISGGGRTAVSWRGRS
jgi:aryl-alcohol dehydrogenase-like predicted oxidoreductase